MTLRKVESGWRLETEHGTQNYACRKAAFRALAVKQVKNVVVVKADGSESEVELK